MSLQKVLLLFPSSWEGSLSSWGPSTESAGLTLPVSGRAALYADSHVHRLSNVLACKLAAQVWFLHSLNSVQGHNTTTAAGILKVFILIAFSSVR